MEVVSAIPWWKSRIIVGILVSLVLKALVLTELTGEFSSDKEQAWVDFALLLASVGADIFAGWKRVTQEQAPELTATTAGAEIKNAADVTEGGPWRLHD